MRRARRFRSNAHGGYHQERGVPRPAGLVKKTVVVTLTVWLTLFVMAVVGTCVYFFIIKSL